MKIKITVILINLDIISKGGNMITNNINYLGYMQPLGYMPFYFPNVITPQNYRGIFQYDMNPQMIYLPLMNNYNNLIPNQLKNSSFRYKSVQSSKKVISKGEDNVQNLNNNIINKNIKITFSRDKRARSEEKNKKLKKNEIKSDNNINSSGYKKVKVNNMVKHKTPSPKKKDINILPVISNNNEKNTDKLNKKKDIFSHRNNYDNQISTNSEKKKTKNSNVK